MFCDKCGSELKTGGRFCEKCGNEVVKSSSEVMEHSNSVISIVKFKLSEFVKTQKDNINNNDGKIAKLIPKIISYCTFLILIIWSHISVYKFSIDIDGYAISPANIFTKSLRGSFFTFAYVVLVIASWVFVILSSLCFTESERLPRRFWSKIIAALGIRILTVVSTYFIVAIWSSGIAALESEIGKSDIVKINGVSTAFLILGIIGFAATIYFCRKNIDEDYVPMDEEFKGFNL